MNPVPSIIVSIHPQHARNILAGRKTVELRRRFPEETVVGGLLLIYSSKPDQAILGVAWIEAVQKLAVKTLWARHEQKACLTKNAFFDYFAGRSQGFGVILGPVVHLTSPIPFRAPRTMRFLRRDSSPARLSDLFDA